MERFKEVSHTADLGAKIFGTTVEELFENAAFAMFSLGYDLGKDKGCRRLKADVSAEDRETLLITWLNELLYISRKENIILTDFKVHFDGDTRLFAEMTGVDTGRVEEKIEIKAATYHNVHIKKNSSGYEVTVIFDV